MAGATGGRSSVAVILLTCLGQFTTIRLLTIALNGCGKFSAWMVLLTGGLQDGAIVGLIFCGISFVELPFYFVYLAIWTLCRDEISSGSVADENNVMTNKSKTCRSLLFWMIPSLFIAETIAVGLSVSGVMLIAIVEMIHLVLFKQRLPNGIVQHVFITSFYDAIKILESGSSTTVLWCGCILVAGSVVLYSATYFFLPRGVSCRSLPKRVRIFDEQLPKANRLTEWYARHCLPGLRHHVAHQSQQSWKLALRTLGAMVGVAGGSMLLVNIAVLTTMTRDWSKGPLRLFHEGSESPDNFYFMDNLVFSNVNRGRWGLALTKMFGGQQAGDADELLRAFGIDSSREDFFLLKSDDLDKPLPQFARITDQYVGESLFSSRSLNGTASADQNLPVSSGAVIEGVPPHIVQIVLEGVRQEDLEAVSRDGEFRLMPNFWNLTKTGILWSKMYSANFNTFSQYPLFYTGFPGPCVTEVSYVEILRRDLNYRTVQITNEGDIQKRKWGFNRTIIDRRAKESDGSLARRAESELRKEISLYPDSPVYYEMRPEVTHPPFSGGKTTQWRPDLVKYFEEFGAKQHLRKSLSTRWSVDEFIGDMVRRLGTLENVSRPILLVICSDHGYGLESGRQVSQDIQFHIPFLISDIRASESSGSEGVLDPEMRGTRLDNMASNVDIWPTIFDILKIRRFSHWGMGRSLMRPPPPRTFALSFFTNNIDLVRVATKDKWLKFVLKNRREANVCDMQRDPKEKRCAMAFGGEVRLAFQLVDNLLATYGAAQWRAEQHWTINFAR